MNSYLTQGYLPLIFQALSAIVLPFVFFVWRQAKTVRENDLKRLNDRLDTIERHLDERLERIERQMAEHMAFHLTHPWQSLPD